MKFIAGFIIAAFFVASSTQSTPFKACKEGAEPKDLRVKDCTEAPCSFYRGANVTAEWDFTVPEDTKVLNTRVRATVLGATVTYPFPQRNACHSLKDANCPLDAGEDVTYLLNLPIKTAYPKIPLVIEFAFLDDNQNVVVCFMLDAKVVDQ